MVDDVGANVTTFLDVDYDRTVRTFYEVRAYRDDEESPGSPRYGYVPNAPADFEAESAGSTNTIFLSWDPVGLLPGFGHQSYYEVQYREVGTSSWTTSLEQIGPVSAWKYFEGLQPATHYEFRIRAHRDQEFGGWSDVSDAWTLPEVPELYGEAMSITEVHLEWEPVDGADYYRIWVGRGVGAAATGAWLDEEVYLPNETEATIGSFRDFENLYPRQYFTPGTSWTFKVVAYTAGGQNTSSEWQVTITLPLDLRETSVSSTSVGLLWDDVDEAGGDEDDYIIEWFSDSGLTNLIDSDVVAKNTSTHTVTNLDPATTYYFRVRTTNDSDQTVESDILQVTTT